MSITNLGQKKKNEVVSFGKKKQHSATSHKGFGVIWNISAQICKQFSNNVLQIIMKIGS